MEGVYVGSRVRPGQFGDYKCHYVQTSKETYSVSGAMSDALFGMITYGTVVMIVFVGYKIVKSNTELYYKEYELYTKEHVKFKLEKS